MSPSVKNIIAVAAGIFTSSIVNMTLIMLSSSVIPLPEGVDPSDMESLKANMANFPAKNFIFPFLAHALGTLVGAFVAVKIAVKNHLQIALIIGAIFLLGGIMMVMDLPAPMWFNVLDLVGAYIPMAWLGWKMADSKK
jgi:hypothetical protein